MENRLVQIGDRVFNLDYIQVVRRLDDGSVKIFMTIPDKDHRVVEYAYEGDEAKKIFAFFTSKATKVA
jgi:hypothetical protein